MSNRFITVDCRTVAKPKEKLVAFMWEISRCHTETSFPISSHVLVSLIFGDFSQFLWLISVKRGSFTLLLIDKTITCILKSVLYALALCFDFESSSFLKPIRMEAHFCPFKDCNDAFRSMCSCQTFPLTI